MAFGLQSLFVQPLAPDEEAYCMSLPNTAQEGALLVSEREPVRRLLLVAKLSKLYSGKAHGVLHDMA